MTEFAALLAEGNVDAVVAAWSRLFPGDSPPRTREHAEVMMHHARAQSRAVPMRARAWSHRWLVERGLPSGLPDVLRPRAERLYPVEVEAVGIATVFMPLAGGQVLRAVKAAVLDIYADTARPDPAIVRARMREVRTKERKLLGV